MVVEHADRPQPDKVGDVNCLIPGERVDLLILALPDFGVKATTISTVHFKLRLASFLVGVLCCACTALAQESPTLRYANGTFIIRDSGKTLRVPAISGRSLPNRVEYRKDEDYAVWDSRGLTIRKGARTKTSRLPDISLTPKLFSRDEIIANRELIAKGIRSKNADAVSGSKRIADKVYFLVRWDDKYGVPWLEALVEVDFANSDLQAKLLGKFDGLTTSNHKVDDLLFSDPGYLRIVGRRVDKAWGVSSYEVSAAKFSFKECGQDLLFIWRLGSQLALVEERTSYDSKVLARLDVDNGASRPLREFQGSATLVSPENPVILRLETPRADLVQNLDTSAELDIYQQETMVQAGGMVIVWPRSDPTKAVLYDPKRWTRLATAAVVESSPEPAAPALHSHSRPKRHGQPEDRPSP